MTILFGTSTASMEATGYLKGIVAGAGAGLGFGTIGALVDTGKEKLSPTLIASSTAVGAFIGCISGTRTNTVLENGLIGAGTGALSALLTSKLICLTTNQTISGMLGSVILGTQHKSGILSLNCWKQVLRDQSDDHDGKRLDYVLRDERIKNVVINEDDEGMDLQVENCWNEKFKIKFLVFNNQIFAHAEIIS
ncbi:prediced GPI-anchored 23-like [Brachionus plicatilis]|uniref:Prediced GPI-anchored 23-like n=1 Tax=Brachionus plicatilis TaxID=10195 RepID=A0A3M7R2W4_BRAPC|nr:prediced GPI-anchored 23-like [Brachionus plicatilis]